MEQTKSDLIGTLLSSVLSEDAKIAQLTQFVKTYYLSDPSRFSFDPVECTCAYNKNGKKCAVGLFLSEEEAAIGDAKNLSVVPLLEQIKCKNPVINAVPSSVWVDLQIWHDFEAVKIQEVEEVEEVENVWFENEEEFDEFFNDIYNRVKSELEQEDVLFGDDYFLEQEQ